MKYNKIEEIRKEKKITQKELCEKIHITRDGYIKMLSNKSMKIDILEKIADYFELPITYFFEDEETNNIVKEITEEYRKKKNNEQINFLMEQIKLKDEYIKFLQTLIDKKK